MGSKKSKTQNGNIQQPKKDNDKTALRIETGGKFEKDLKKVSKYPKFDEALLKQLLDKLANGESLDAKYKDHKLAKHSPGELSGCRDFHLTANICVVYMRTSTSIRLIRIGSHQDLGLTESLEEKN